MSGIIDQNSSNYGHGIVSQNCLAKEYSAEGIGVKVVLTGTFVKVHSIRDDDLFFCVVRDDMQVEMNQLVCKKADVISVPENLWGPLFTVTEVTRLSLLKDRTLAESIGNIFVGHTVQVLGPDNAVICIAKVTFRNTIARLGVGIYFGLEVVSPRESLQSIIEKVSLLEPGTKGFPRGCDIVVTVDKIRPNNCNLSEGKSSHIHVKECQKHLIKRLPNGEDEDRGNLKSATAYGVKENHSVGHKDQPASSQVIESSLNHSFLKKIINSDNPLNVGDEVVYLDNDTPERGVVKWMGLIDNSLKIGVEFENPIGSGTGAVKGYGELFKAKYKHALIVPPMALIKLSDFEMNTSNEINCFKKNSQVSYNNNYNYNNNIVNDGGGNDENDEDDVNDDGDDDNDDSSNSSNSNTYNKLRVNKNNNNNSSNKNINNYSNNCSSSCISISNNYNNNNNNNNNINNNYNNNYHNNNSIISNNINDYCKKKDFCCKGKQSTEEIYKKAKKVPVSHLCLKHPEKNIESYDCIHLMVNKDEVFNEKESAKSGLKLSRTSGLEEQQFSRSLDIGRSEQRSMIYKRHCNSVDNGLMQKEYNLFATAQNLKSSCWNHSGHDLCELQLGKEENIHSSFLYPEKKFHKSLRRKGDDSGFSRPVTSYLSEKNSRTLNETDKKDSLYLENSSSDENLSNYCKSSKPSHLDPELGVGSVVELTYNGEPHYGVIRWIGSLPDEREDCFPLLIAGIETEEESPGFTDGTFNNKRYFQCNPGKALFVPLKKCRKDSRFLDESQKQSLLSKVNYGQIDCPIVEGTISPINRKGDIESICGKNRGIQGHHNSCYLDATLFSMFAFTSVFDSLLYRPPTKNDIPHYSEVQRVLREEIVNPLRKNLYVRADRVMKLRTLLEKLSSVSGLTSEEKDPEEFLNSLLAQILKAEPFLKLSSGQEAFHYQLFVEKDERLVLPSVQQLFEQSFVTSDIKLKQVPSCLIIQMPRFGKSFKMYSRILPPQLLDITDIIENSPRQCTVCGRLAEFECKDCFGHQGIGNGLESISFCKTCLDTAHNHHCRNSHNSKALTVPVEFCELQEHCVIPRLYMELFAVVCIETSHYVAFVKCGSGSDAPWCFFDSMADRKGEQNGYNIPEMVPCPDLPYWLSEEGAKILNEMRDERQLPEHAKRLFSDAYMCMYQSPDLMMYR